MNHNGQAPASADKSEPRAREVAEILFLLEWATQGLYQAENLVDYDRTQNKFIIIQKANTNASIRLQAGRGSILEDVASIFERVIRTNENSIREVKGYLPAPGDTIESRHKWPHGSENNCTYMPYYHFHSDYKARILTDPAVKLAYDTIIANDNLSAQLLGFRGHAEYEEFISPTFETIKESSNDMVRKLLRYLVEEGRSCMSKCNKAGYPRDVVFKTMSALERSNLITIQGHPSSSAVDTGYYISDFGKCIVSKYLDSLGR